MRVAYLFTERRWKFCAFSHHLGDPTKFIRRGQPGYDNLQPVQADLEELRTVSEKSVVGGKENSVDEVLVPFQGAHAELKQNCHKYKTSDGLQADTVCKRGGYLKTFAFRGDSALPRVSIKGYAKSLSPLHQRLAPRLTPSALQDEIIEIAIALIACSTAAVRQVPAAVRSQWHVRQRVGHLG